MAIELTTDPDTDPKAELTADAASADAWLVQAVLPPEEFLQAVQSYTEGLRGHYLAQLLWQRGWQNVGHLGGFLRPDRYQPTSPFAFGAEMEWAIARLLQARDHKERVAIWGDFDADGVTATAVLWEGLGAVFPQGDRLTYVIPNRLTESHGLSRLGLERLAAEGYTLIVTCDTGSTNQAELELAQTLGLSVIITDHHTLLPVRPPVVALINPRNLPSDHPLADLSGVAVAYKLVEALYDRLPGGPPRPLDHLLDLVAIGLIADLVALRGDCRYLAQLGIGQLQRHSQPEAKTDPKIAQRPGVVELLRLCRKSGDRPTDISFGIGPRINAVSRIHGDASFCVTLLTSSDEKHCRKLANDAELANARRKALQRDVAGQVQQQLEQVDLSTELAIVLADPQWPVGVLGLVASQIAREYGRPTFLLNITNDIARGSARSVSSLDLYALMQQQADLVDRFGGHPMAAGLSLPAASVPLFREGINRQLRQQGFSPDQVLQTLNQADLVVTVAELGQDLFRELKLLEPCGMGNPVPKLLVENCWFTAAKHFNIKDSQGQKLRYIYTKFQLCDDTNPNGFPGVWWEHYAYELPGDRSDAIVELDYNTYSDRYEARLVAVRPQAEVFAQTQAQLGPMLLDWRPSQRSTNLDQEQPDLDHPDLNPAPLQLTTCPQSWQDLQQHYRKARDQGRPLALAYTAPARRSPREVWQRLIGLAKYLQRTGQIISQQQAAKGLGISSATLQIGINLLNALGFLVVSTAGGKAGEAFGVLPKVVADKPDDDFQGSDGQSDRENRHQVSLSGSLDLTQTYLQQFLVGVQEDQFQQQYFSQIELAQIDRVLQLSGRTAARRK